MFDMYMSQRSGIHNQYENIVTYSNCPFSQISMSASTQPSVVLTLFAPTRLELTPVNVSWGSHRLNRTRIPARPTSVSVFAAHHSIANQLKHLYMVSHFEYISSVWERGRHLRGKANSQHFLLESKSLKLKFFGGRTLVLKSSFFFLRSQGWPVCTFSKKYCYHSFNRTTCHCLILS